VDRKSHNDLWWHWRPNPSKDGMFEIVISATKGIPQEELVKVAASVREHNEPMEVTATQMRVRGEDYAKY